MKLFSSSLGAAILGGVLGALLARTSNAQEVAAAQLLFEQGRDLLRSGQFDQACPKLAESQRLAPATGTLLALAMCHEAQAKLASAWAEYAAVAARASREGQAERETHARAKIEELRPRLSTLEVRIPAALIAEPGLEVRRDGMLLGQATWNTAVPLDGGIHELQVTAPERVAWSYEVTVASEHDAVVVEVPVLATVDALPATRAATSKAAQTPREGRAPVFVSGNQAPPTQTNDAVAKRSATVKRSATAEPSATVEPSASVKRSAVVVGGLGAAAWLVGGAFFYATYQKKAAYDRCSGSSCDALFDTAHTYGNWATGLGVAGGALLATGAVLYWWVADSDAEGTTRVGLDLAPERALLGVTGSF